MKIIVAFGRAPAMAQAQPECRGFGLNFQRTAVRCYALQAQVSVILLRFVLQWIVWNKYGMFREFWRLTVNRLVLLLSSRGSLGLQRASEH